MPEKAIFAVRSGVIDKKAWTPDTVLGYYGLPLQEAGFSAFDKPIVQDFPVAYMVTQEDGNIFKTLTITDVINDPPIFEPADMSTDTRNPLTPAEGLIDAPEIFVTTFVWVLCGPVDGLPFLRDLFRKTHPSEPQLKWWRPSKFVALYDDMPASVPGYPNKPPIPSACLAQPEPVPAPIVPDPIAPPPPPVQVAIPIPVAVPEPAAPVFTPATYIEPPPRYYEPPADADAIAPVVQPKPQKKSAGAFLAVIGTLATLGYQYGGKLR